MTGLTPEEVGEVAKFILQIFLPAGPIERAGEMAIDVAERLIAGQSLQDLSHDPILRAGYLDVASAEVDLEREAIEGTKRYSPVNDTIPSPPPTPDDAA